MSEVVDTCTKHESASARSQVRYNRTWYESESESDDDLEDKVEELALRTVLDVPVGQQVTVEREREHQHL